MSIPHEIEHRHRVNGASLPRRLSTSSGSVDLVRHRLIKHKLSLRLIGLCPNPRFIALRFSRERGGTRFSNILRTVRFSAARFLSAQSHRNACSTSPVLSLNFDVVHILSIVRFLGNNPHRRGRDFFYVKILVSFPLIRYCTL